jgi:hypothetical protein
MQAALPTRAWGQSLNMTVNPDGEAQPTVGVAPAIELMARAQRAEETLASVRATLAEHVEENLTLHRRVSELEAALQSLVRASAARVAELEKENVEFREALR